MEDFLSLQKPVIKILFKKIKGVLTTYANKRAFERNGELRDLYSKFKASPEGHWIVKKNDALLLYEIVKKYKPMNILELGAGIGASTAIIALASDENASISSIEQYQKCIDIAEKLIPEKLLKKIKLYRLDTLAFQEKRISKYYFFAGYKQLPVERGPFDFLIIDGPGFWIEGGELVKLPGGDLINLIPHLQVDALIYIDGRKPMLNIYKRFLSAYFDIEVENKKYALLKKNNRIANNAEGHEIKDKELEQRLRETNYFYANNIY